MSKISGQLLLWLIFPITLYLGYMRAPLQQAVITVDENRIISNQYLTKALDRQEMPALVLQQMGINYGFLVEEEGEDYGNGISTAINVFKQAIALDDNWVVNYLNLAALYASQGNYPLAMTNISKAVYLADSVPLVVLNEGVIAEEAGDLDLADKSYRSYLLLRKALPSGPFWDETDLRRSIRNDLSDKYPINQFATKTIEQIISDLEVHPFSKDYRLEVLKRYIDQGEIELAKQELTIISNMTRASIFALPQSEIEWYDAVLAHEQGDFTRAIAKGESAIDSWRLQSINGPGTYGSNQYAQKVFRSPAFLDDLVPQVAKEPLTEEWFERLIQLGEWYLDEGNREGAIRIFNEVLAIDPDNKTAVQYLNYMQGE